MTANGAIAAASAGPGQGFINAANVFDAEVYPGAPGGTGYQAAGSNSALVGGAAGATFGVAPLGIVSSNGTTPQNGASGLYPGQGGGGGVDGGAGGSGSSGIIRVRWIPS